MRKLIRLFLSIGALTALSFSAYAVDYMWTGNGNDGLWSNTNNWADANGNPVSVVPSSDKPSVLFDVPAEGLLVTLDMASGVILSNIVATTSAVTPGELKIVSSASAATLDFSSQAAVDAGVTCVLNVSPSWSAIGEFKKVGAGTLAFDYKFRTPGYPRQLTIKEGRAVVLATSLDPHFIVNLDGTDPANPPVFENRLESGLYSHLDTSGIGGIQLNGTTMNVGDSYDLVGAPCVIPSVSDGGTLAFLNERVAVLAESSPKYDLELDRADVNYGMKTVVSLAFDDENEPFKDNAGFGSRLVPVGNPTVVEDATRGKVLSLDGTSYFKGPDVGAGLAEFSPGNGFTISFWFKPDSDCDRDARIFLFGEPANNKSVCMRLLSSATVSGIGARYNINYGIWGSNRLRPEAYVWDGNWHHFAATHDGKDNPASFSLYFDGQLVGSMSPNISYAPPNKNLYFGRVYSDGSSWNDGSAPYKGRLDDLLILNYSLSGQEIQDVYANGLTGDGGGEQLALNNFTATSAGVLSSSKSVSVKTISGTALAGGLELKKYGSSLTVGTGAGATATTFNGTIVGDGATLAKVGADYTLTLDGVAKGVSDVAVNEGTLRLRRPTARQGLVCHYSFDDPTDFGHDDGPGGLNLTKGDSGTPTAVAGVRGNAIHFSGATSPAYFDSGNNPRPAALPSGDTSFTFSLWIRPASGCDLKQPFFCWGKNASGECSQLRLNNASNGLIWNFYGSQYEVLGTTSADLTNGQWHHIVGTYDATTRVKKLYCDGAQIGTKTIASSSVVNISPTYKLELARYSLSDAYKNKRYEGDMDEFMIFDYAWTDDEVAAEYNGTADPANVSVTASLPTPVARWTFDGDDPLADTTGSEALHLSEATTNDNYNVTFVTGDAICGKAAKFSGKTGSGYLKLDTFPEGVIPAGKSTFTAIARYRPDTTQVMNGALCVVGWGSTADMANGSLFRIGPYQDNTASARFVVKNTGIVAPGTYCSSYGNDRTRWYTVAVTYQPAVNGSANAGVYNFYVDGALIKCGTGGGYNITAQDFAIGAGYNGTKAFCGLVDDIQVYDCALSEGQVRMIADQFEASKGKDTTNAAVPAGVLTGTPDVTVASGATLKVASVESIGNLSGAGTVEIASLGRLNFASSDNFTGTVTGDGVVGISDDAVLDIGDGSSPLLDIDCPLALGANVNVTTSASAGRILVAHASAFVDAENLASWTATVPSGRTYSFDIADAAGGGKDLYLVVVSSGGTAYVNVVAPQILYESDTNQYVKIGVSYWESSVLTARVEVVESSPGTQDPGALKLDSAYASRVPGEENVYYVELCGDSADIAIESMDGTSVSSSLGFTISASIVSSDINYVPDQQRVVIYNVAPVCDVTPENSTAWDVVIGGAPPNSIRWQIVGDAAADFAGTTSFPGIRVSFFGCDNPRTFYVTEPSSGTFTPDFGSLMGTQDVTLEIVDKDRATQYWTYRYEIGHPKETVDGISWRYWIGEGTAGIIYGEGDLSGDITLPSVLDGYPVTSIGGYAFENCTNLTSVTIPACVTNVGRYAFYNCTSLANVVFEGNAPTCGERIFENCASNCVVLVYPGSTGWGVGIPGTWNGVRIEYIEEGIVSAKEQFDFHGNMKGIVVNNPTASIGSIKTPWVIVRPDGKSGFANDFTTNALSVVSEDGTNYYAHVEGENGDRTKVIHFTVNENGIPSKHGDIIDTTLSGEENNANEMKKRKLIGIKNGFLCFYPVGQYGTSLIYKPKTGEQVHEYIENEQTGWDEIQQQRCLASYQNDRAVYILCNIHYTDSDGEIQTKTMIKNYDVGGIMEEEFETLSDEDRLITQSVYMRVWGDSEGNISSSNIMHHGTKLPGSISGITYNNREEFFATTPVTNAFYNVTLGQYNVVKDNDGNPKPMVPKTKDGLIRVIDNRSNGGKFLCITTKEIIVIEE